MLKPIFVALLVFLGGIVITNSVFSQSATDSLNHQQQLYTNVENNFHKALGPQSRLFNGKRYEFYDHAITSNPYFMDNADWHTGSVLYDGYLYQNVDMLYDMFKDEIVIRLYNSFLKISLINDKVKNFDLLDHHFKYLKTDPDNSTSLKTGFYDVLYGGKIEVLARREKTLQVTHSSLGEITSYFTTESDDYYIYKNGNYYPVNSQGAFLNVLKDKKKDLEQFIKANKIKYRKGREQAMAMIAGDYDHLSD